MIHFEKVPEPSDFEKKARQKGRRWLEKNPDAARPRDYWSPFKAVLASGFKHLCAYSAMHEPVGSIDHYISVTTNPMLAYEWSNYRFASEWINKSKKDEDDNILDPYEVQDDWFELLLPSLQLVISPTIPDKHRQKAEYTLIRLHLRDDERVIRQRQTYYEMYCQNELTLDGLKRMAPLIAVAILKMTKSAKTTEP